MQVVEILTYNDLMKITSEEEKIQFLLDVISEHERSPMFQNGRTAGLFYRNRDIDLEKVIKVVYDREGIPHLDKISPNHKLATNLFHIFITQLVSYLLGNGIIFEDNNIKKALGGSDFDFRLQQVLIYAALDGEGYGFVTDNGVVPLCYACKIHGNEPFLAPLKDEDDGIMKAAVRYWRLAPDKPLRITLYELDGFTEYKENENGNVVLYAPKRAYKTHRVRSEIEGDISTTGENYSDFPIVPMGFINGQSSIVGNREKLFAYDVVLSGMVNNVDMNTIYWIIQNADGMDKRDDLNFVGDIIQSQVVHTPDGTDIRKEEISSRHEAYISVLDTLRKELFHDFQAVDTENLSAGNKTTVEIKSAYENLNLKCDEVEKYISDFVRGCLRVKGLDENAEFHFKRPNNINEAEYLTTLANIAPLLNDDIIMKLACETLGIIDEYEKIKEQKTIEEAERFKTENEENLKEN